MRPTITTHLPRAAAFLVLSGLAGAQAPTTEAKVPRPIPYMEDIKTPPPPPPVKEALPPEEMSARALAAQSIPESSSSQSSTRPVGSGYLAGIERKVYLDEPGDGAIWAVGDTYKASFDASGATYIPYFGSAAPRNFPVRFRVAEILLGGQPIAFDADASPARNGERITFDRGAVLEVYDLSVDSIEQSFVFERLPGRGELVVRLAVESELERSADGQALLLQGELGAVRYGRAVSFDARGKRTDAPTAWAEDSIEIRVPAERVAGARFPLVIDPVVSTFTIVGTATEDDSLPDVAYDASTLRSLMVCERVFSATDHDVYMVFLTTTGFVFGAAYIDSTTAYWANPRTANNGIGDQFLVVAQVGVPSSGLRIIRGRTREATGTGTVGAAFTISATPSQDCSNPDVGGDPNLAPPTFYCVVWQREVSSTDSDIHGRLVLTNSTLLGSTILIDNSLATEDTSPSISGTDGQAPDTLQEWNVVWRRIASLFDGDLHGAQIHWDGLITNPSFAIDTTGTSMVNPSASSLTATTPRRWMVAYTISSLATDADTGGKLLQGPSVLDTQNLSTLVQAPSNEHQLSPSVDCDGTLFVMADAESFQGSSTNYDIYVSTFSDVGGQIDVADYHVSLATSSLREDEVEIVATGSSGGPARRAVAVWHQETAAGNGDIEGALYDADPFSQFCNPGYDGVIACPCGNSPLSQVVGCNNSDNTGGAYLVPQGGVSPDTVILFANKMRPSATCIYLQGNGLTAAGTTFGDGVRCVGGTLKRLYVKTSTVLGQAGAPDTGLGDLSITARSAALGDTILPGTKRWYQTYYRDPISFACVSPATFNISAGIQIDW